MRLFVRVLLCLLAFVALAAPQAWAHDSEPINTEFAAPFAFKAGNVQFGFQYAHNLRS